MQSFLQRHRVLLLHFSFWCVYLSFFVYQITSFRHRETDLGEAFFQAGIQVAFHMVVAYMNYFFFLPRFLERKNVGRYLLEFFVPFIIIMFFRVHLQRYLIDGYAHRGAILLQHSVCCSNGGRQSLHCHFCQACFVLPRTGLNLRPEKKELENENLTADSTF